MKTVLITGATGDVGTHLRRELAGKYKIRASDLRPMKKIAGEAFIKADISKMSDALKITKGVDAVIHLGGYSVEGPWEGILNANIIGCYNVFEAARRNGVKRILFPTSNHAVGFYRRDRTIDHNVYPKPDGRYGVSKVFGEALGSLYADKYGMEMFMMRIGNVGPRPIDKRRLSIWFSPRDSSPSASTSQASSSRSSTASRATSARGTTTRMPIAWATSRRTTQRASRRRSSPRSRR
jgi:uronate dehydrogenase